MANTLEQEAVKQRRIRIPRGWIWLALIAASWMVVFAAGYGLAVLTRAASG